MAVLSIAFGAIKAGDVTRHRRWMIRAFAIGVAVLAAADYLAWRPSYEGAPGTHVDTSAR